MNEPSREHVEAVAKVTASATAYGRSSHIVSRWDAGAEDLLTSTDPEVLDAMQDALVRAGRLRIEHECYADSCYVHFFTEWQEVEP